MNKPMPPTPLRQEDYLAIESAVMETARGRWFLSEYARRNRNADTDTLLNAIDKLEKSIIRDRAPSSLMDRVRMDLADMAAAIEKTKQEIAQIKHEDNEGAERFERASSELDAIVSQTETATGDILGAAEKIQEYAWTLREAGSDEEQCNALDAEATNIYMACSFQDLTGQRIRKIVDAMRYVESRINSMIDIWGFESEEVEVDEDHHRAHDARPDAHLLNGPALEGEGVGQSDVDVILDHHVDAHEANQDDVDALFDNVNMDADVVELDAVAIEPQVDAVAEDLEIEASEPLALEVADDVEAAADTAFVDMDDLDWAEAAKAADIPEAKSIEDDGTDVDLENALADAQADVFAPQAEQEAEDLQMAEADIFASDASQSPEADVFAADAEEDAMPEQAELRDRVAEFS